MNATRALRQYQNVSVQSEVYEASPHRLIQMLINGGIGRLVQARGAMQRGLTAEKGMLIGKALGIIGGLRVALDMDKGGDLAVRLDALYGYMSRRLLEANRNDDGTMIDEVLDLLRNIKEGWDGIAQEVD